MKRKFIDKGSLLLEQGMEGQHVYIIESGIVEVSFRDDDGDEVFLARLGPGALIGEMVPLLGGRRRATVVAEEDLTLVAMHSDDLQRMVQSSPNLHEYLTHLMTARLQQIEMKLEQRLVMR